MLCLGACNWEPCGKGYLVNRLCVPLHILGLRAGELLVSSPISLHSVDYDDEQTFLVFCTFRKRIVCLPLPHCSFVRLGSPRLLDADELLMVSIHGEQVL